MRFVFIALFSAFLLLGCIQPSPSPASQQQLASTLDDAISELNQAQLEFIRAETVLDRENAVVLIAEKASFLGLSAEKLLKTSERDDSKQAFANIARVAFKQASEAYYYQDQILSDTFDYPLARQQVASNGLSLFTSIALDDSGKPSEFAQAAGESTISVSDVT